MGERVYFETSLPRLAPPWLQRSVGGRLLGSLGKQCDALVDRLVQGVALRFPLDAGDADALTLTGAERRIRRGPAEDSVTYARRIRPWWDAHRVRGGPYALLQQMRAYLLGIMHPRIDVVYYSGARFSIDTDGAVTRSAITWGADASGQWAQFWVFLWLTTGLTDSAGVVLTTSGLDELLVTISDPADLETVRAIPREWSAAHVKKISIVLLTDTQRLWNYPQPVPTWAEWGTTSLWGDSVTVTTVEN